VFLSIIRKGRLDRTGENGMAREAKKRIGRPPRKPPTRGTRVSLGLKVTAAVKRHLDSALRTSGRTQSQEAEHLIEKALAYERLEAIGTMIEAVRTSGRTQLQDEHRGKPKFSVEIELRTSGRTQSQAEHRAGHYAVDMIRVLAISAAFAEIEGDMVEAALERRNWRRDDTTGHWIPPEVHRLPPDGSIEQSAPAAERREK
jgi:hypothetical protein